jgi:hypothetical protein
METKSSRLDALEAALKALKICSEDDNLQRKIMALAGSLDMF